MRTASPNRSRNDRSRLRDRFAALASWSPRREEEQEDALDRLTVRRDGLVKFLLLLFLSVVVATFGLVANSTAVVIGAMLLAPLMTPVLGVAVCLTTLERRRMTRSALLVAVSTAGAIGLAWALARVTPLANAQVTLPSEVLARTSPTTADLLIALAAGTAGAIASVRHDVSDALPGVAVAVALVPPLSAVGITLADGENALAWGAFLLYVTNLIAIAFAAAVTFAVSGFVPDLRESGAPRRLATSLLLTLAGIGVVWVPLSNGVQEIIAEAEAIEAVESSLQEWLGPERLDDSSVLDIDFHDDTIAIAVTGPNEPPAIAQLAALIADRVGAGLEVELRWIPQTRTVAVTGSG